MALCGPQKPLSQINKDKLEDTVQEFWDDVPAPLHVNVKLDADGTYTVQAIYPPCPPKPDVPKPDVPADTKPKGTSPAPVTADAKSSGKAKSKPKH